MRRACSRARTDVCAGKRLRVCCQTYNFIILRYSHDSVHVQAFEFSVACRNDLWHP